MKKLGVHSVAKEKRLIDANALIYEIAGIYQRHYINSAYQFIHDFFRAVFRRIYKAPTVDAVEVVHARWAFIGEECCVCSACHNASPVDYYYCPECGAKMDLEK